MREYEKRQASEDELEFLDEDRTGGRTRKTAQTASPRIQEDRLEQTKKRKRNTKLGSILVMFGCLIALVLVTYAAGMLYMWIDNRFQQEANDLAAAAEDETTETEEIRTYTQEEVDAMVAAAKEEGAEERSASILDTIKNALSAGTTTVETLRPFYPDELVVVANGVFNFVPINDALAKNDYVTENLVVTEESEEHTYVVDGETVSHKGIDVSKHQGNIDWDKVAADGVEFAFIRVGYRGYGTEGKMVDDEQFESNIKGATAAGIKVGVYFFSQAITEEELLEEADYVLTKIADYDVTLPVVYDVEKISGSAGGRMNALTVEERTALTKLFCDTITEAGYTPMIYHNMEMSTLMLDLTQLEDYAKWFAYYNDDFYYPYAYEVWQYSEKGTVDGISEAVDLNLWLGDFPE